MRGFLPTQEERWVPEIGAVLEFSPAPVTIPVEEFSAADNQLEMIPTSEIPVLEVTPAPENPFEATHAPASPEFRATTAPAPSGSWLQLSPSRPSGKRNPLTRAHRAQTVNILLTDNTPAKLPDLNFLRDVQSTSRNITEDLDFMINSLYGNDYEPITEADAARDAVTKGTPQHKLREALITAGGSAWEAYRTLDCNYTNSVSLPDFFDGLERLSVDWKTETGISRKLELFSLFDTKGAGTFDLAIMFPEEAAIMVNSRQQSSSVFWKKWSRLKKTPQVEKLPKWKEGQVQALFADAARSNSVVERRKWMQATYHRLKRCGKSDCCIRDIICSHLPHGSGPRDRQNAHSFGDANLRKCKWKYLAEVRTRVKSIQGMVHDFKCQRQELQDTRRYLVKHTAMRTEEEERKRACAQETLAGFKTPRSQRMAAGTAGRMSMTMSSSAALDLVAPVGDIYRMTVEPARGKDGE